MARLVPWARARSEARWMVGPSAMGSENGTPSSITSAPASTRVCIRATVCLGAGSPAVMKGIRALLPCCLRREKVASNRDMQRFLEFDADQVGHGGHILVTTAGEVDQQHLVPGQGRRQL